MSRVTCAVCVPPQLPVDLQQKVKSCLNSHQQEQAQRRPDFKVIKVPISTFPPTAMVYAVDKAGEGESGARGEGLAARVRRGK